MKRLAFVLLCLCWAAAACILLPAPFLVLLPFTIAASEYAPYVAVFQLGAAAMALRYRKRLVPLAAASLLVTAWPLWQIPGVRREIDRQLPALRAESAPAAADIRPVVLPLNIHFYRPQASGAAPTVVDIYGGAWQRGSPGINRGFDSRLAARGYAVFAIDYRHAPAYHFPAQFDDVNAALAFIRENAAQYHADPRRLILLGRSSGAELALLAAYQPNASPVSAVISIYGPADLVNGYSDSPFPDPIDQRAVLRTFLGGTPDQLPERYRAASPVTYVRPGLPPTLLIHGSRDHIVKARFARELHQALTAAGDRSILIELPWAEHAFDLAPGGTGTGLAFDAIVRFLQTAR